MGNKAEIKAGRVVVAHGFSKDSKVTKFTAWNRAVFLVRLSPHFPKKLVRKSSHKEKSVSFRKSIAKKERIFPKIIAEN